MRRTGGGVPRKAVHITQGPGNAYFIPSSGSLTQAGAGAALCDLLKRLAPPRFRLEPLDAQGNTLLLQHRELPDARQLLFVAHQEGTERQMRLSAELEAPLWQVEELSLESGEVTPVAVEADGSLVLSFAPYQARLLRFSRDESPQGLEDRRLEVRVKPWTLELDPDAPWSITALAPNVLRLGTFELALEPRDDTQPPELRAPDHLTWHWVTAKPLIDQCADLSQAHGNNPGARLPVAFHQTFGTPMKAGLAYPLTCWYRCTFHVDEIPADAALLMDRSAISGDFVLELNGQRLSRVDFGPHTQYDHLNRRCTVAPKLVRGRNTLLLRVRAQRDWDGLVEPLYVTGTFGAYLNGPGGPTLGRVPERATARAGGFEGYPYYAGTLSLKRQVVLGDLPDTETFAVDLPRWGTPYDGCAEVLVNGHSLGVRCWSPYGFIGSTELLSLGANTAELRLTNTLIGMLEGSYFDPEAHRVVSFGTP